MSLPFNITNPGFQLGGALTTAEQEFVTNLVGLTYAQGDVLYYDGTDLFNLGAGTSGYFLKTQGAGANPIWAAIAGGGDALVGNSLAQFAATTSLELKGVMSDETGSGPLVFGTAPALSSPTGIVADDIAIATGIGSPTINQVQEYFDNTGSSGFFLGGELSDGGAGTLDVAAGSGFIRTTNDENAELQSFKWSASVGIAVTDNTTQYVYVDDSGAISLSTDEFLETPDKIQIGVVTKEGGSIIHQFALGVRLAESIGQMGRYIRRVEGISRDTRKGGLIFGQSGDANRDITMTAGVIWWGRTDYTADAIDTSGVDTFFTYSSSGQEDAVASQWPNTQYDNAGTLTTMTNNRWANLFFWLEPDGHLIMVYGRSEFTTEAQAENEGVPSSSLPSRISETGMLAGRFTFQKSANSATISSAFEELFANAGVTDHGTLAGLTDDDHEGYALLIGRSGGQTLIGGTDAGDDLVLASTSNGTKGIVRMGDATTGFFYDEVNGRISLNADENTIVVGGVTLGETLAIHGIDDTEIQLGLHRHSASATTGAVLEGQRSRGTEGAESIVQDGDVLFNLVALGHDGVDYALSSRIRFEVDGTPGSGDMPGRIVFSTTPDGSETLAEAMRISQDKAITMGGTLAVTGAVTVGTGAAAGVIESNGNFDLTLQTGNATTGSITITDGTSGDITISPNGIGQVVIDSASILFDNTYGIQDQNDNEQLMFSTTTSAVNEFTIKNAATGNAPELSATGSDTNIDLTLTPKGTGIVKGELKRFMVRLVASATDTATGTTIEGDYRISNRAITVKAVGAYVDTAGTTGTMTIDIHEAGTTIMTTNKITLDTTEKSSETAATAPAVTDSAIAADAILTFDVDGVHTTAAKGLTVWVDYVYA